MSCDELRHPAVGADAPRHRVMHARRHPTVGADAPRHRVMHARRHPSVGAKARLHRTWLAMLCAGAVLVPTLVLATGSEALAADCDATLVAALGARAHTSPYPAVGFADPTIADIVDPLVAAWMSSYPGVFPGGTIAVTHDNQLILARAYGAASEQAGADYTAVDSRYRIASVSKVITAMAILKLVHDGGHGALLAAHPFPLHSIPAVVGGTYDKKLNKITVDELLHHAGGFDRSVFPPGDMEGYSDLQADEATVFHSGVPPDCPTLLSYVESQPLQFTPGTRTAYSNLGFCVLSQVVAEASGMSFATYVQNKIFAPLKMTDTSLGATPQSGQQDREVGYYYNAPQVPSLFVADGDVTLPYGGAFALESTWGGGGFVSSSIDLARLTGAIASGLPMFPPVSHVPAGLPAGAGQNWPQLYYTLSAYVPSYEADCPKCSGVYGMGWDAAYDAGVASPKLPYDPYNLQKGGDLEGSTSQIIVTADGYSMVGLLNGAPPNLVYENGDLQPLLWAIYHAVVAAGVPDVDFFPQFGQHYSAWTSAPSFPNLLAAEAKLGYYPSRIEGRQQAVLQRPNGARVPILQYRARFAPPIAQPPTVMTGAACSAVLSAVESASPSTELVSLQHFRNTVDGVWLYQAVWATVP